MGKYFCVVGLNNGGLVTEEMIVELEMARLSKIPLGCFWAGKVEAQSPEEAIEIVKRDNLLSREGIYCVMVYDVKVASCQDKKPLAEWTRSGVKTLGEARMILKAEAKGLVWAHPRP